MSSYIMVRVSFDVKKRYFLIILFALAAGFVISQTVYNPAVFGHNSTEVEVTINGNTTTLQEAIDNNLLGGSGSVGFTSCEIKTGSGYSASVSCNSSEVLTGGGCKRPHNGAYIAESYPSSTDTWSCSCDWVTNPGTGCALTAYAICCS